MGKQTQEKLKNLKQDNKKDSNRPPYPSPTARSGKPLKKKKTHCYRFTQLFFPIKVNVIIDDYRHDRIIRL